MNDLISIIVPVYNNKKYLEKCINSILNQSYKNIEVILIDDGSTDGSEIICDDYVKNDSRIIVKHIKNLGVSNARNIGINISNGKYITFVDSDDYVDSEMYENMLKCLISNDVDVVICNYTLEFNDKVVLHKTRMDANGIHNEIDYFKYICMEDGYQGFSCNKLYKREVIKKNFSNKLFFMEDLLFNLNLNINKCYYINKSYYHYVQNSKSVSHSLSTKIIKNNLIVLPQIIHILEKNKINQSNRFKLELCLYILKAKKYNIKVNNVKTINKYVFNDLILLKYGSIKLKLKVLLALFNMDLYLKVENNYKKYNN